MPDPIHGRFVIHHPATIDAPTAKDSGSQPRGAQSSSGPASPAPNDAAARHVQSRQNLPVPVCVASLVGEKSRKGTMLKNWAASSASRTEKTYHELLQAARNLEDPSRSRLWKPSLTRIIAQIPCSPNSEHVLSVDGQHPTSDKPSLPMAQTDEVMATLAGSKDGAHLPPQFMKAISRLITGYLQWKTQQSNAMEPISVSCCMGFLKGLHRGCHDLESTSADYRYHEYLAQSVSDKSAALSESVELTRQSPLRALFMYKLMERIDPGLRDALEIDSDFIHEKPEVCALLAAARQGHLEVIRALTQNEGESDKFQQPLLSLLRHGPKWTPDQLHQLKRLRIDQLKGLLPLLQQDPKWSADHWHSLEEMDGTQLIGLLPLLEHDPQWTSEQLHHLKEMNGDRLAELLPLLEHDPQWTTEQLHHLKEMDGDRLAGLLPLLEHDPQWTAEQLHHLKEMDGDGLAGLLPLLEHDPQWTTEQLHHLKKMDELQFLALFRFVCHDPKWTAEQLPHLKEINATQLKELLSLMEHDPKWAADQLPHLKKMAQLDLLLPLLQHDQVWVTDQFHHIKTMPVKELQELSRLYFLELLDKATKGLTSAANPYVRNALSANHPEMENPAGILNAQAASRSTLEPGGKIASYLTEKFNNNYQKIPEATFGVENEMYIPGIPNSAQPEIQYALNEKLGVVNKDYRYVGEPTLNTKFPFATPPIEQVTSILESPEDVQRLQSVLSILNDWGAFTNDSAGVHIHTGVKQWKAANCLNTPEEKNNNRFLSQWDSIMEVPPPEKVLLESLHMIESAITPYQLLFMKQFLVNMVAMQEDFYLVSKESPYSIPNSPKYGSNLDEYYKDISNARSYLELLFSANVYTRNLNVNLEAYEKHGTIEIRGFTKKNSDNMEVDPNLPIRDLVFLQEVLIKALDDMKGILLSGVSPEDQIDVRPSKGLTEIVKEYVQDVFLLEILHALGQRDPERRMKTMNAIVQDKRLIPPDILRKVCESQAALLKDDPLAQHFLDALSHDGQWTPASFAKTPLKRLRSLRSMADAGFSGKAGKP